VNGHYDSDTNAQSKRQFDEVFTDDWKHVFKFIIFVHRRDGQFPTA